MTDFCLLSLYFASYREWISSMSTALHTVHSCTQQGKFNLEKFTVLIEGYTCSAFARTPSHGPLRLFLPHMHLSTFEITHGGNRSGRLFLQPVSLLHQSMSLLRKARLSAYGICRRFSPCSSEVLNLDSCSLGLNLDLKIYLRLNGFFVYKSLSFYLKALILALCDQVLCCSALCTCTLQRLTLILLSSTRFSILKCTLTSILFPGGS